MATQPSPATDPCIESSFAAPMPANDDMATGRVWHPCGPPGQASIDATSDFLHGAWAACQVHKDHGNDFEAVAIAGYKAKQRDVHERVAEMMVYGASAHNAAPFTGRKGRSIGQPLIELSTIRMIPDLFVSPSHPNPEPYNEVIVLRHECATMTPKRFDLKSTAGILAITRHALERIHERSLINGGDLHETLRSQLYEIDYALAFAYSAGIHLGTNRLDRLAATALPFCDGLLIVQNRIIAMRDHCNPSEWQQFSRAGTFFRHVALNPLNTIDLPPLGGFPMHGFLVPVAATFVPADMLRNNQKMYLSFFRRHLERCYREMPDLPRQTMRCFELHKVDTEAAEEPHFIVPDMGRRLLGEVLHQRVHQTAFLSIGWGHHAHPRNWK